MVRRVVSDKTRSRRQNRLPITWRPRKAIFRLWGDASSQSARNQRRLESKEFSRNCGPNLRRTPILTSVRGHIVSNRIPQPAGRIVWGRASRQGIGSPWILSRRCEEPILYPAVCESDATRLQLAFRSQPRPTQFTSKPAHVNMSNGRRLAFLVVEAEPAQGLSTRKLLLESAKHNVVTAYFP